MKNTVPFPPLPCSACAKDMVSKAFAVGLVLKSHEILLWFLKGKHSTFLIDITPNHLSHKPSIKAFMASLFLQKSHWYWEMSHLATFASGLQLGSSSEVGYGSKTPSFPSSMGVSLVERTLESPLQHHSLHQNVRRQEEDDSVFH